MLKIRLKRLGAKKNPTYRIIVINSTTKREGRPIQELGHYNPKTKVMKLDKASALDWISKGAQPTETVAYLIKNCNDDGTLNYVKKETAKLSKKALAKKQAEEEAAAKASEEAKAAAETEAAAPAEETPAEEVKAEEAPTVEETPAEDVSEEA
jgi:small subunit ribosomal protein S16